MKSQSVLTYIGLVLIVVGGASLSIQLGLTGLGNVPWAMFAIGILLVIRDSVRQLSERVRALEAQLARGRSDSGVGRESPPFSQVES
jgi:hypothetical protein